MAVVDRITLQFRDDEVMDIALSNILSDLTPKRNRAFKAKELLVDYFKKEMTELYREFYKEAEAELKARESNGYSTVHYTTLNTHGSSDTNEADMDKDKNQK